MSDEIPQRGSVFAYVTIHKCIAKRYMNCNYVLYAMGNLPSVGSGWGVGGGNANTLYMCKIGGDRLITACCSTAPSSICVYNDYIIDCAGMEHHLHISIHCTFTYLLSSVCLWIVVVGRGTPSGSRPCMA